MIECQMCDCEIDEDDMLSECPYCECEIDEEVYWCENCEALVDCEGYEWTCPECFNENPEEEEKEDSEIIFTKRRSECPSCGAEIDDEYCDECGWPDVNQGWVGENYG